MSTHGAPRPSGGTYYAASYRGPGSPAPSPSSPQAAGAERSSQVASGAPVFPPIPPPGPDPALYEEPRRPGPGPVPSPVPGPRRGLAPPGGYGSDGFPPMDPSGFGPGAAPGTGYAVPGSGGDTPVTTPPRRRANRGLPIVVGTLAVVLVLCIGGGAAAYFFLIAEDAPGDIADRPVAVASTPAGASTGSAETTTGPSSGRPAGGEEAVSGDLSGYQQGDCLTVDEPDDNRVDEARCTDPGAYKVLLRKNGTLDDSVCEATDATFSLSQDAPGSTRDFVLCVGPVD